LTPDDELLARYHRIKERRAGVLRVVVAVAFGLLTGVSMSSLWNEWLLFANRVDFGTVDPIYDADVGFYVFQLPFYGAVVDWMFASFVIILLIVAVAHYLNGGIRLQPAIERVTPQVKAHLSVLLACLALIKAADYWLQRYELTLSTRGIVDGMTYTEQNAQLPAIYLLLGISLISCGLFLYNIRRRGWVLPVVAVGLWSLLAIVAGEAYPAFIQRFVVQPNQSTREQEAIGNNIEATRAALGLDEVQVESFEYSADQQEAAQAILDNPENVRNVPLLDPKVVTSTYQRFQGVRSFYRFSGLDADRYMMRTPDGDFAPTLAVLANRELDINGIPQSSWEGQHLAYTHGFGMALSAGTAVTTSGQPDFAVLDVPTRIREDAIDLEIEQPRIYFGEGLGGYSIVGTSRPEVDYVGEGEQDVTTEYTGTGGVPLGSFVRQSAFALRFNDFDLLISRFIDSESRILYIRDVRERVRTLAPFLEWDSNPYPVAADGRLVYMLDGYTTSAYYPNAQRADNAGLAASGDLAGGRFNYVRNSVKAVVDAYDGTVELYVMDQPDADPVVEAYQRAFPGLFADADTMSQDLRNHLRYPGDLFRVQTAMWGQYHIQDAQNFYNGTNFWSVAQEPPSTVDAAAVTTSSLVVAPQAAGQVPVTRSEDRVDPYYQLLTLPGEDEPSFVLSRTFVPQSASNNRNKLTAFMMADSDPEDYGRLRVYEMPSDLPVDGPSLVGSRIQQQEEISRQITALNQQGSQVQFSELYLVPVGRHVLYVRALYVTASGATPAPELKNVIVVLGDEVVMADTLREALAQLFDDIDLETLEGAEPLPEPDGEDTTDTSSTSSSTSTSTSSTTLPPDTGEPGEEDVATLIAEAGRLLDEAEARLKEDGDLGAYQESVRRAQELLARAEELTAPSTTTTTTTVPGAST
jgi:hypothetical protein